MQTYRADNNDVNYVSVASLVVWKLQYNPPRKRCACIRQQG